MQYNNIKVSVIMAIFNDHLNVSNSVRSILSQTYKNFELIIIDDGSDKKTKKELMRFKKYKKVKIYNNKKNYGLSYSLNKALNLSSSDIIFRMDSDDISHKDRLKLQLDFLNKNPKIDILGTNAKIVFDNVIKYSNLPLNDFSIRKKLLFSNQFFHSSVVFKKKSIKQLGNYNKNFKRCQDYDLWLRARKELRFANLKEKLITYRSKENYQILTLLFTIKALIKNILFTREFIFAIISVLIHIVLYIKKNLA